MVGVVLKVPPLDDPQAPLVGAGAVFCAEQLTLVPPFWPLQVQYHGPDPETEEANPALHKLVVGAVLKVDPLDDPQTPFIGVGAVLFAEQLAVVPPF